MSCGAVPGSVPTPPNTPSRHEDGSRSSLGDLPLALEQAGAYIDTLGISFAAYLARLANHASALLARRAPRDYDASVATTWTLAFERLESDPDARRLLSVCAVLAANSIPDATLTALIPDVMARDRSIEAALRFSLVTASESAISMHPLVQQVAMARMSEDERADAIVDAATALAASFPTNAGESYTWPLCLSLHPHVVHLMAVEFEPRTAVPFSELQQLLVVFRGARSEYELALPLLAALADAIETTLGQEAEELILPWSRIGFILAELGSVEVGEAYVQRALAIAERMWEPVDSSFAMLLDGAGNVCDLTGNVLAAIEYRLRALEIYEQVDMPSAAVAGTLSNLGGSYMMIREFDDARQQYESAIALLEEEDEPHLIAYANAVGGLADVYDVTGKHDAALPHHERSIELLEQTLAADNLLIARARINFCWTLVSLDEWARARSEVLKAEDGLGQALPDDRPTYIRLRRICALIAYAEGDLSLALDQLEQAIASTDESAATARRFQVSWMAWIHDEMGTRPTSTVGTCWRLRFLDSTCAASSGRALSASSRQRDRSIGSDDAVVRRPASSSRGGRRAYRARRVSSQCDLSSSGASRTRGSSPSHRQASLPTRVGRPPPHRHPQFPT